MDFTRIECTQTDVTFEAPSSYYMSVKNAFYGRRDSNTCTNTVSNDVMCEINGILPLIQEKCDGFEKCSVQLTSLQDTCPTVAKYLDMQYTYKRKLTLSFYCLMYDSFQGLSTIVIQSCKIISRLSYNVRAWQFDM